MTHEHLSFDPERLDDEIDTRLQREKPDLLVDSSDTRLLTDLRRVYRSGEEDSQSLARVYLRLQARARSSRRLLGQPAPSVLSNARTTMRLRHSTLPDARKALAAPPGAQPPLRRHAVVGVVAVVALIALSAGIFSYFAIHGAATRGTVAATPHPACAPSQATVSLPAHITLTAIAPVGTDDGWAVGGTADPQQPQSPSSAVLLRLRNCHWAAVGAPILHATLSAISMVTADEGWAVGATYTQSVTLSDGTRVWDPDQPLVLHYTHGSWQTVKVTAGPKTSAEQVKMVSANEGWMLLNDGKHLTSVNGVTTVRYGDSLRHYQNGTWADVPLDFLQPSMWVADLDARAAGEVWLVGAGPTVNTTSQSGFAAHYAHGAWTAYVGAAIGADVGALESVSELAPTDVWVAGTSGLRHFDGARWSKVSVQGTIPGVASGVTFEISRVAMLSPTDGWAFPSARMSASIEGLHDMAVRYVDGAWTWTTLGNGNAPTPQVIVAFAPSSPTQGWAIALQDTNGSSQTVLVFYEAGPEWTAAWGVVRQQT